MIFRSAKWRSQLKKEVSDLQRRGRQQRWTQASLSILEQQLMLAFYIVRKMVEGHATHPTLLTRNFKLRAFPSRGKIISYVIWPDIAAKYNLQQPTTATGNVLFIANQFIHSFVFRPTRVTRGGLSGVFIASDREKDQRVFWLSVTLLQAVIDAVATSRSRGFRVAPDRNELFYP